MKNKVIYRSDPPAPPARKTHKMKFFGKMYQKTTKMKFPAQNTYFAYFAYFGYIKKLIFSYLKQVKSAEALTSPYFALLRFCPCEVSEVSKTALTSQKNRCNCQNDSYILRAK